MKTAFLGLTPFSDGDDVGDGDGDGGSGDGGGDGDDSGDGGCVCVWHPSPPASRQAPLRSSQAQSKRPRRSESSAQEHDAGGRRGPAMTAKIF